jgi:hypothetical protein
LKFQEQIGLWTTCFEKIRKMTFWCFKIFQDFFWGRRWHEAFVWTIQKTVFRSSKIFRESSFDVENNILYQSEKSQLKILRILGPTKKQTSKAVNHLKFQFPNYDRVCLF